MKAQDCSFNSFVFDDIGDRSAMIRLFRRAWANRIQDNVDNNLYSPTEGFNPEAPEIAALKAIAAEFSQAARNSGQVPLILLINNQGYSDHLYQALTKRLNTVDALVVSTHTVVSPNDPRNFLGDGHFTHEANLKIGEELRQTIREALR